MFFVAESKGEIKADSNFIQVNSKYGISDIKEEEYFINSRLQHSIYKRNGSRNVLNRIKETDKTTSSVRIIGN